MPVDDKATVLRELQRMPNIGPSIALDLYDLGIRKVADLKRKDPQQMYDELMAQRGAHIDRCQLYVFRAAVYYAKQRQHDPELVPWWKWSDKALAERK
jgi:nucleotidyltransferase/DNA polymerase involved in DNA repair